MVIIIIIIIIIIKILNLLFYQYDCVLWYIGMLNHFLKTRSFINFILAYEEILPGNLISIVCIPPVIALNYPQNSERKVGLNHLTSIHFTERTKNSSQNRN